MKFKSIISFTIKHIKKIWLEAVFFILIILCIITALNNSFSYIDFFKVTKIY